MLTALTGMLSLLATTPAEARQDPQPEARMRTESSGQLDNDPLGCWPYIAGEDSICADAFTWSPPIEFAAVRQGDVLRFRILYEEAPKLVSLRINQIVKRDDFDRSECFAKGFGPQPCYKVEPRRLDPIERLDPSTRTTWRVDLPPGKYELVLGASWEYFQTNDGKPVRAPKEAVWEFGIEVGAALPTTGLGDRSLLGAGLLLVAALSVLALRRAKLSV
ncbi:MAG TPA: hypothetical protein VGB83_09025 [Actinomycetota bacterium]